MTAKRKRPKVRYVVIGRSIYESGNDAFPYLVSDWEYYDDKTMKRIAAALNLYEAVRRGEM